MYASLFEMDACLGRFDLDWRIVTDEKDNKHNVGFIADFELYGLWC